MSRKSNTKKFIKDVLNDRYSLVIGNEIILDSKVEPTVKWMSGGQVIDTIPQRYDKRYLD